MTDAKKNSQWKTFTDELEIAGDRLVETVTRLVSEGNVRTLRIRTDEGQTFMEIPLTVGAVAGGIVVLTAPWLAAIGAIAGIASKVHLDVIREEDVAAAVGPSLAPPEHPSTPTGEV